MRKGIVAVLIVVLAGLGLAACGHTHSGTSATSKIECGVLYLKWHNSPSYQNIKALQKDVTGMMAAAKSHQQGEVKKDASNIETATKVVSKNLPPKCVPGVDPNLESALGSINTAAVAATKNDYPTAKMNGESAIKSIDLAVHSLITYAK